MPAGGRYARKVEGWGPRGAGGFTVLVDESNTGTPALRPPRNGTPGSWTWQTGQEPFALGARIHTVRLVSRPPARGSIGWCGCRSQ